MDSLQNVFEYGESKVRVVIKNGEPWFVARDVCDILKHTNSRVAVDRLDDDEKGVSKVYTPGGLQEMTVVSESGLYTLVLTSNLPEAKRFKKWVTSEVLPQIRKTGTYISQAQSIEDLIIMQAQSMKQLKAEVAAQGEQIQTIKETLIEVDEDWRRDINLKLNRIAYKRGGGQEYSNIKTQSYDILEDRAHCDLATRLRNLRARLELRGETQTKINNVNYLDVIEADPRIKEIYTTIVKELAIREL